MDKGLASVKTLTAKELAKKWKLPLSVIAKKIAAGVKVEKEHTKSTKQAGEIARDHLSERPDYYDKLESMEKKPVVKEESGTGGVRGLGYVSGDPSGMSYVDKYIDTNSMSYEDENGNNFKYLDKIHGKLHKNKIGFKSFDPRNVKSNSNKDLAESLGSDYGTAAVPVIGDLTGASRKVAKEDKDPCWKGYKQVGMKNKKGRKVPNCVPVEEQGSSATRYTERPMYEKNRSSFSSMETERGIYEETVKQRTKRMQDEKKKEYFDAAVKHELKPFDRDENQKNHKDWRVKKGIEEAKKEGYQTWPGQKKKKFFSGPKDAESKTETQKWAEKRQKEREEKAKQIDEILDTMPKAIKYIKAAQADRDKWVGWGDHKTPRLRDKGIHQAVKKLAKMNREKNTNEETQIDEISQKLAGRYRSLASTDLAHRTSKALHDYQADRPVDKENRRKSMKRLKGIKRADKHFKEETQIDEISAELVGKVSNARWRRGEAPSKTLSRAVNKKFIETGKKKDAEDDAAPFGGHKRSHEKSSTHVHRLAVKAMKQQTEETTMDTKELINEALDNILEENLVAMKENLQVALQEKMMEKLEERKKNIAADYFAQ